MTTVSIVMPCYNAAITLPETLESIAAQTHIGWKLYAINDGSKDSTLALLNAFKKRFPTQVIVIDQDNAGQVKSKNKGLRLVGSDLIAFLDADDIWDPEKLALQLELFNQRPEVGLCYTNGKYIDKDTKCTGQIGINSNLSGHCLKEFLMGNAIVASSVMVRKSILEKIGLFDENLSACENWELWTRISSVSEISVLDKFLVYYRRHDNNMSHNIEKMKTNRLLVIKKNNIQYKSMLSDINQQTQIALFRAYAFFGENALWHLKTHEARRDLFKALSYRPQSIKCWILLLKSYLGKTILGFIRRARSSYV